MICDWWISIRLCVSVFQSSLLVIIIIMIDSSKNEIVKTASEIVKSVVMIFLEDDLPVPLPIVK